MRKATEDKLQAALEQLCGEVGSEFTIAVKEHWRTHQRKFEEERKLKDALRGPNAEIRKAIHRLLGLRDGESLMVSERQWCVDYSKPLGREVFRPHLSFTVYISPGIRIEVAAAPHHTADADTMVGVMLRTLRRVQLMIEAARQA